MLPSLALSLSVVECDSEELSVIHLCWGPSLHQSSSAMEPVFIFRALLVIGGKWDHIAFCWQVSWPLSLLIPSRALRAYQLLFRHLFRSLHVQRQLCVAWHMQQALRLPKEPNNARLRHSLGQRMLYFVESVQQYSTVEVRQRSPLQQYRCSAVQVVVGRHIFPLCLMDTNSSSTDAM